MLDSMYSAVSGLQANQAMLDTVGNNIANVNTVGFKTGDVTFEDLLSQTIGGASAPTAGLGGINPYQVGLGVRIAGTSTDFTQGTSQNTGRPLDVSIQGDGFLIGQSNGQTLYTRAGSLSLDANGQLTSPDGMLIQGWTADQTGAVNTNGPLGPIAIPTGAQIPATATKNITLNGNVALTNGTPPTTSVNVFDSLGNQSTMTLSFAQSGSGWTVTGSIGGTTVGTATLPFSTTNGTTTSPSVAMGPYTLQIASLSANGGPSTVAVANQDGAPAGSLETYSISSTGLIEGAFSNGQTRAIGQLALASFANPAGLAHAGDTNFSATANSGLAQIGTAGSGSRGLLSPGTLEASNVDLGKQFTELITAQRGYEANTKVVTTSNTVLGDLVNMVQ